MLLEITSWPEATQNLVKTFFNYFSCPSTLIETEVGWGNWGNDPLQTLSQTMSSPSLNNDFDQAGVSMSTQIWEMRKVDMVN